MPASSQTYTADGTTAAFSVPFPYLSREHVFVSIGGVQVAFSWDDDASVRPATVPAAGATVEVRRFTPTNSPPIDFRNTSVLLEDTLETLARYCAYLTEETREADGGSTPYTLATAKDSRAGGVETEANLSVAADGTLNALPGGSTAALLGGVVLGNFTLDTNSPDNGLKFPETNPQGWNMGIGRMTVDTEIYFNNYFAANPSGHVALILRATSSLLRPGGAVRGQGALFGYGTGFSPYPIAHAPMGQLESWFNAYPPSSAPGQTLPKNSETPPGVTLKDGTPYRVIIESSKASDGNRYFRLRVYTKDTNFTPAQWLSIHDTGDVIDVNNLADLTQSGFGLGHVFSSNLAPWSIQFSNCKVTWGPCTDVLPDLRGRFSRYGGDMEGSITFTGAKRRLRIRSDGLVPTDDWTFVEANTDNSGVSLIARPRGTATASSFGVFNSSNIGRYGSMAMTMLPDSGRIQTFSTGGEPARPIDITVQETRAARFDTTGVRVLDATVPIGTPSTDLRGTNMDGSWVRFHARDTLDWDTMSTDGTISGLINSAGAPLGVERVCLPLYGTLGWLITELRNRKVI